MNKRDSSKLQALRMRLPPFVLACQTVKVHGRTRVRTTPAVPAEGTVSSAHQRDLCSLRRGAGQTRGRVFRGMSIVHAFLGNVHVVQPVLLVACLFLQVLAYLKPSCRAVVEHVSRCQRSSHMPTDGPPSGKASSYAGPSALSFVLVQPFCSCSSTCCIICSAKKPILLPFFSTISVC